MRRGAGQLLKWEMNWLAPKRKEGSMDPKEYYLFQFCFVLLVVACIVFSKTTKSTDVPAGAF